MGLKIDFRWWLLKKSTYKNNPIFAGGPLNLPPVKIGFSLAVLKSTVLKKNHALKNITAH